jgi:hypothetical protein
MVAVNGWELFAHPPFLDQPGKVTAAVERPRKKDPSGVPPHMTSETYFFGGADATL